MTYVASPSFSENPADRKANLEQCLRTAKHRLDEVSKASNSEKQAELVASAIEAGWSDEEVRSALANEAEPPTEPRSADVVPLPVVPLSSM